MFSPVEFMCQDIPSQPADRLLCYNILHNEFAASSGRPVSPVVEIVEQPVPEVRFRYECEGRSAGCIRGIGSTDKQKTYPTIKVYGYQGAANVVVSCVTREGPPYYPHPHKLVGKKCNEKVGICYKSINTPDMMCSFERLGIQCVKKKDIKDSLSQKEAYQVDPYGTGFSHHLEPKKINLNVVRLCFQVFLPDDSGKLCIPLPPVISNPIFDSKAVSDLTICKLSHCSAPVTGGQEVILLCGQINKDDIQILFYEELEKKVIWCANGKFGAHHVHRKVAISFQTPVYKNINIHQPVECFIQLRRPSDGAVGKPVKFTFAPLVQDPERMVHKRNKFEALHLDRLLQPNNLPSTSSAVVPRVIKQAVRSKNVFESSNKIQRNLIPETSYQIESALVQGNVGFMEGIPAHSQAPSLSSSCDPFLNNLQPPHDHSTSHQKVDDISAPKDPVGTNNTPSLNETPSDETLDRLSSLDLGIDPNELDVNLSGITLDSFSES